MNGLAGSYFNGKNFRKFAALRLDANVDFHWGTFPPVPQITDYDDYAVRWTGYIQPLYSEAYTFYTLIDDGARLWINGKLIINQWHLNDSVEYASAPMSLSAGRWYPLTLNFNNELNGAVIEFLWKSASQSKEIVPTGRLAPNFAKATKGPTSRFCNSAASITKGQSETSGTVTAGAAKPENFDSYGGAYCPVGAPPNPCQSFPNSPTGVCDPC